MISDRKCALDTMILLLFLLPEMMNSWQGWWTSGVYENGINDFLWTPQNNRIPQNHPNWGFKKTPFEDTCLWIMQISVYNYTWGNYDCHTKTGYICEINVPYQGIPSWT